LSSFKSHLQGQCHVNTSLADLANWRNWCRNCCQRRDFYCLTQCATESAVHRTFKTLLYHTWDCSRA